MKQELIHLIVDRLSLKKLWVLVLAYICSPLIKMHSSSVLIKFVTIFTYQDIYSDFKTIDTWNLIQSTQLVCKNLAL